MGRQMVGRIWESGIEDSTLVAVLCGIAVFANEKTGRCFPALPLVVRASRRSKNVVRAAIKELQRLGYLTVVEFPGKGRNYVVHMDRLPTSDFFKTVDIAGVQKLPGLETEPGSEVNPEGVQKCTLTGFRSKPAPGSEVNPKPGKNQEVNRKEPVSSPVLTLTPEEEKPKRKRDPLVSCPETLPDEWREAAKIARPDIDPLVVWRKFRARHGPTNEKKALKTWKRCFLNWIGREYGSYASQKRAEGGAPRRYADERYRGEDEVDYTYGIGEGFRPLRMG